MSNTGDVFLCDAVRTPIGRYGGALAKVRTDDLAAIPIRALMERNPKVDWAALDEVVFGCANQAGEDNRNVARMALLLAGLPDTVPGVTVNRLCASGLNAVGDAARAIRARRDRVRHRRRRRIDDARAARHGQGAGGVPAQRRDLRHHARLALHQSADEGAIRRRLHAGDRRERRRGISGLARRPGCLRAALAAARRQGDGSGLFRRGDRRGRGARRQEPGRSKVDKDEHPRPETTLEGLAKLKPFVRNPGTITAGNASGINDGAAAVILASAEAAQAARAHAARARARHGVGGVPPRVMGIGPVPSTRKLMARLGLKIGDFDLIELNEAFASQGLACLRQLGVADDAEHVNPHGGAIALGHPLGMSGARLALTAVARPGEARRQARARHHVRRRGAGRFAGARAGLTAAS